MQTAVSDYDLVQGGGDLIPDLVIPPNENHRQLLGVCGLNPHFGTIASSRLQMYSSQIGQHLEIAGLMPPYHKTGMEMEYGKATFSIKMPANGMILKIFDLYPSLRVSKTNPLSHVLYETISDDPVKNGTIGIFELPRIGSQHQYFGYSYRPGPAYSRLQPGKTIKEGEVILQTTSVHPETEEYMYGRQVNVAYMSHPGAAEDGMVMSTAVAPFFNFKTYNIRVVEWGSDSYPLPLYSVVDKNGNTVTKVFPDIGDYVRDDGLLMVTRKLDDYYNLSELDRHGLTNVNTYFDNCVYAVSPVGRTRGKVIDIRVYKNSKSVSSNSPLGLDDQAEQYYQHRRTMMQLLYNEYKRLKHQQGRHLKLSPKYKVFLRDAIAMLDLPKSENSSSTESLRIVHRKTPLDSWRVEFVIEFDIDPYPGNKITGIYGDKGVVCTFADPEEMPVDADGNRADIIMDGDSTVNRMNAGRLYQAYVNGASRDLLKRICAELRSHGVAFEPNNLEQRLRNLDEQTGGSVRQLWSLLAEFYKIVSVSMKNWVETAQIDYISHIATMLRDKVFGKDVVEPLDIYMPPDDQVYLPTMIEALEREFPQCYGPVSFKDITGRYVTTKEKVRIASVYVMMLEKIADDWAAVSSGKVQHHGVLAKITTRDKFSAPVRESATRTQGESEVRLTVAYAGPEITAEMLDRNNNPAVHKAIYRNILRAKKPSNISIAVDRREFPLGSDKPGQLIRHIAEIGGWKFVATNKKR